MKTFIVDYKKRYGGDGVVYTQTIKIDKELKQKYNSRIRYLKSKISKKTIISYDEMKILSYAKTLKNGTNYLHLTGLRELEKFITKRGLYDNRLFFNRNTIIEVL